jgi:hypothetical protein
LLELNFKKRTPKVIRLAITIGILAACIVPGTALAAIQEAWTPEKAAGAQGAGAAAAAANSRGEGTPAWAANGQGAVTPAWAADAQSAVTPSWAVNGQGAVTPSWAANGQGTVTPSWAANGQGTVTPSWAADAQGAGALARVGAAPAAGTADAVLMPQTIMINDEIVEVAAYNINGNNYCKLRNVGWALNFDVLWDEQEGKVHIASKAPYHYEATAETFYTRATAARSSQPVYLDGKLLENLTVYNIGGNNYFMLRELGMAMDFSVIYNAPERRVEIDEAYGYDPGDKPGQAKFITSRIDWQQGHRLDILPGRTKMYSDYRSGCAAGNYFFTDAYGNAAVLHIDSESKRIYAESHSGGMQMGGLREIPFELDIFGAFFEGRDSYYIAFGQRNTEQSGSKEVYRLVRYDKSWNRLGAASVTGGESNTRVPYDSAIARIAESGDGATAVLYAARERYSDKDGVNHQSNFMLVVNTADMTPTYVSAEFPENHVSHSFAQFAQFDGGALVTVDHGDAFPRSVLLQRNMVEKCTLLDIAGIDGDNNTNAISSGFEISDRNYIYLGCSAPQTGEGQEAYPLNVFVSVAARQDLPGRATLAWLTDYSEDITAARLVKLGGGKFVALWQHGRDLEYVVLDGDGRQIKEKAVLPNTPVPPVQPLVLQDGSIVWFQLPFEMDAGNRLTGPKTRDVSYIKRYSISV